MICGRCIGSGTSLFLVSLASGKQLYYNIGNYEISSGGVKWNIKIRF